MLDDHRQAFREETRELLADLEAALIELEERPDDGELIGRIFRALHTIKGSGSMFGREALASFTHQVESVFDMVRNGELAVSRELITCALAARDQISCLLDAPEGDEQSVADRSREVLASLDRVATPGRQVRPASAAALTGPMVDIRSVISLLTEYERSRVKASVRQGRPLYMLKKSLHFSELDERLAEAAKTVNGIGELLSSVPSMGGAEPGCLCFDLLFASTREPAALPALLGSVPLRVDATALLPGESGDEAVSPARPRSVYRIRFTPRRDSLREGTDPLAVIEELRWLGDCYVVAQTGKIPGLEELEPENCYVSWDIILATYRGIDEVRDVFIYVEEGSEVRIELVDDGSSDDLDSYKRLGEILVERGDISAAELKSALTGQKPIGELLVASHLVQPDVVESALVEQQFVRELRRERQPVDDAPSLRVPAQKLDLLVNLVGEMVTVQARLSQSAGRSSDPDLLAIAEEVERLTAELRDTTLNIRMLPIGTTFTTFKRLVRTLAKELGKDVQLTTVGGETELDKTVIERLNDPFVHLIRNCIDHGIEAPDARAAAGKPRQGTVHLAASHSGDSVQITISDDGAGLDRAAIRARGVERGLIHPASELGDRELYSLIFAPGFSTATTVTDVSGRGVGMDVVKRSIDALRGTIDITSQAGQGTAINIRLPLTLAIIESLLVSVGTDRFVLPLPMVEECVELTSSERRHGHGDLVDVRGQLVPYIPLRERFAIVGEPPPIEQVVIARVAGERVGIVVDHVIGEHQAVIKSLGQLYRNVRGVSGATVLGDGTLALIVDVPNLLALERDSRV